MTIINNSKQILKIGRIIIFPGASAIVNRANWATTVSMNEEFEDGLIKGQIIAIDDGTTTEEGDYEAYLGNPSEDGMFLSSTIAGVRSWVNMLNPDDFASLVDGKVPADQLPSYVDDVLEYANLAGFPGAGETGKIYIAIDTNKSYRWSGSAYVEISSGGIALGETSATAYRGDRGKTAYDHSQATHAPANAQKNSDITKAEIEAKLTGEISSHTHAAGGGMSIPQGAPATLPSGTDLQVYWDEPTVPVKLTPEMTSDILPSGLVISSGQYSDLYAWKAFGGVDTGWLTSPANGSYIGYVFDEPTVITKYSIYTWVADNYPARSLKIWTFKGSNNGTDWTTLDTQTAFTAWTDATFVNFIVTNSTAYLYYKLDIEETQEGTSGYVGIKELQFFGPSGIGIYFRDSNGDIIKTL